VNVKIKKNMDRFHEFKKTEKVGDIYYGMEFVIRKELKYVLLKMCIFFHKYLWALKKSFDFFNALLVANFIYNKHVKLG
jgi:hypothetical protein